METLKYKLIASEEQYVEYCKILHDLDFSDVKTTAIEDEIDLLTLIIRKWDEASRDFEELDPIALLHSLMEEHKMKSKDMVALLGVSKGYVSDILNYKKGLSKDVIRKLSERFKLNQEAFNRPYKLKSEFNQRLKNASVMNTRKEVGKTGTIPLLAK